MIDGLHINGKLTLGENLADLGGVNIAYDAYIKSLNGKPAPLIGGFTGPQRFFMGYAQAWRGLYTRDAERRVRASSTDPHSPERFPRDDSPCPISRPSTTPSTSSPEMRCTGDQEERVEVW